MADYRIIIADPSESSLFEIKEILASAEYEYEILTATDGKEIFDQLNSETNALILNTETISDGFEVIQAIRENPDSHNLPVLMLLDLSDCDGIEQIFEMGMTEYVFKPLRNEDLLTRLHALLQKNNYFHRFLHQAEQLEQLAMVASKSSNAVAIINPNGQIEWVNEGFENMYECSFEEFLETFNDSILNPEHATAFKDSIKKATEEKLNITYENYWFTKSGKEKWIQTTITPILNERIGQIVKLIAIETDITNLKRAESRLEEQNKYLLKVTRHLETTNEMLERQRIELDQERQKSDDLLFNIFPYTIAKQLKSKGEAKLKKYKLVSVLFTDFKGFTRLTEQLDIEELIKELSNFFEKFEEITLAHYIEKIKTIGDSYMCAGGLPLSNKSNPFDVVLAGLEIQEFAKIINDIKATEGKTTWDLRLGIHTGEVIAGIIGKKKFAYDVWGDTVNTASRMETAGEVGKVNISGDTYQYIKDYFVCTYRGKINVKYKGDMEMYFVERLKPEYSLDEKGIKPNEEFNRILSSY
jgi:PAS domain S-box-containing protein